MKKIALLISDGSEEIEALTPVDVLRRANVIVDVFSVCDKKIKGSHGIIIEADKKIDELSIDDYDGIVIPGGMPGASIISENVKAVKEIEKAVNSGKLVSAICASPAVVLANNGLLKCDMATCYPADAFISLLGEKYIENSVVVDKNFITANGPKSAMEFAIKICEYLEVIPKF